MTSTTAPARPALKSVSLGDLLRADLPQREFLISPWLRQQESVLLWAAAGVGKTMFALTLALAMAGGGEVFGWQAAPRKVLIFDGEMPTDDLKARLVQLRGTISGFDPEEAARNLVVIARHGQDATAEFPDFGDVTQHAAIIDLILGYAPDVVILDNLSTLATMDDENGAGETQHIVRFLARLKQAKTAVICVHHSNKNGSNFRGSSMLATTFEAIIGLTREASLGVLEEPTGAAFKVEFGKFRGKPGAATLPRVLSLEEAEGGLRWAVRPPKDAELHALAELVRTGRYERADDLAAALPLRLCPNGKAPSRAWVYDRLRLADARGILLEAEKRAYFAAAKAGPEVSGDVPDDDL